MTQRLRYRFDPKTSQFTVHAFASGLAVVMAHNPKFAIRDFDGEAQLAPPALTSASLKMRIRASSLELVDEVSEYDRSEINRIMFSQVLQTSKFPEILYESSAITGSQLSENSYSTTIDGKLTMHGVTNNVAFQAQVVAGGDVLRGYGSFTLKQSDYGITMAPIAGGTLKMKDELKMNFFIVGQRQG